MNINVAMTDEATGGLGTFTLALQAQDPLAAQLAHFCEVIADGTTPIIGVADALQSLRIVEAVRLSMTHGKAVSLRELA